MLRIFFGYLYSCDEFSDWSDACALDHTFHMFLEGTIANDGVSDYLVHKRVPQGIGYTNIKNWQEYIDLFQAGIDAEPNEMTSEYKDIAGVVSYVQHETDNGSSHGSFLAGGVFNRIVIESWAEEFLGKTKNILMPIPDTTKTNTPKLYADNQTLAADPSLSITGYRAFSITIDSSNPAKDCSYASPEVIVPIHATTDEIFLAMYSENACATAVITVYRAAVTPRLENGKTIFVHSDFMRKTTCTFTRAITAGWTPVYSSAPYTKAYANESTYAYSTRAVTAFCPFEPYNDIIPRVGCEFFNRNRAGLTPHLLVLNTDTHHYYECILLNVSQLFLVGYNQVADKTASLTLGVVAEGAFVDAALDYPLEEDYFFPIKRDYTDAS